MHGLPQYGLVIFSVYDPDHLVPLFHRETRNNGWSPTLKNVSLQRRHVQDRANGVVKVQIIELIVNAGVEPPINHVVGMILVP